MKVALPLIVALSFALLCPLRADPSGPIDAAQRNEALAPTPESSDTKLSPQREANQRTFIRNDHVQDQRFSAPDKIERKDAAVGDRRAPIDVTETRDKNIIDRKEYPRTPEVRERQTSHFDGEKSNIQPKGDMLRQYDTVTKYQSRMEDAKDGPFQREPKLEKRMSFERLNRFVFRRNGPGTENGASVVTPAGGNTPPPSQDTYTKYKVDWKRLDEAK